uniref:Uncharacterized protein n=1 Tax=Urocitellus parryii TaxID=9999 RepID=A0A8D2I727_UROPR
VMGHHNHNHITHLEVLRIHMQLVTVQLTETCKGALEVVEVISQGSQNLLAMGLDLGVTHDGRGRGQVSKAIKEPLGPGIDNQDFFHIHFSPHACDSSLILSCEMNHGVWSRSLSIISDASEVLHYWVFADTLLSKRQFHASHQYLTCWF